MRLPRGLLRHTIVVEDYLGASATGPVYGVPRTVRCYVEDAVRAVRKSEGRTAAAGSRIIYDLDPTLRPDARVTVNGQPREVLQVRHFDGRLGTPDHTELTVQ